MNEQERAFIQQLCRELGKPPPPDPWLWRIPAIIFGVFAVYILGYILTYHYWMARPEPMPANYGLNWNDETRAWNWKMRQRTVADLNGMFWPVSVPTHLFRYVWQNPR